ncbi:tyrosinase cofactor [Saccharothrix sp. S26]|uniref:tyrosinase cofactor n=1 Tax=Saccharothrix sp. S26 TaxID=2907215 RepID=UPI001F422DBD|nr:tyrosinase cofactor [Saccharothrix sp. S26]MCE7001130.1 tyrosinase cofactor [Saccharothrix sp. S26]
MNDISRRDVFRHTATAALIVVGAAGFASSSALAGPNRAALLADPRDFEETYKGKKIKGEHDKDKGKHKIHINGKKLGVVQIELPVAPDSAATYTAVLSTLNHFDPVPLDEGEHRDGLKKLARLAVDQLGDQELTADADHSHP